MPGNFTPYPCTVWKVCLLFHEFIDHPSPYIVRQWINIPCLYPWSINSFTGLPFRLFPFNSSLFQADISSRIISLERNCQYQKSLLLFHVYINTHTHIYIFQIFPFWDGKKDFLECSKRVCIMGLHIDVMWFPVSFSWLFLITLDIILSSY